MRADGLRTPPASGADPGRLPGRLRTSGVGRLGGFSLSLDRPEAFRFLVETLYPPHGRAERWKLVWSRALPWPLAARWILEADEGSGIAREAVPGELPLLHDLAAHPELLEKAAPGREGIPWVVRPRKGREGAPDAEVVFLPPRGSLPGAVLELHRTGESAVCSDEADALRWLASNLPPPLAERVPRVLFHVVRDRLEVLALSLLPGPSAYVELRQKGGSDHLAVRHLTAAADWIVPFHRETRSDDSWALPSWEELASSLASMPEPKWCRILRQRLERRPLPRVGRHGDFWARNVLPGTGDGDSSVVDWETFRTRASPLDDLFDFALSYAEILADAPTGGSVDAFLRAFAGGGFPGPQVWVYVRQVLAGLGVEPGIDRPLLGVYLLDRARHAGLGPPGRLGRDRPPSFWLECFRRWQP